MRYSNSRAENEKKAENDEPKKPEPSRNSDLSKILRRSDERVRDLFERERQDRETKESTP